MSEYQWKDVSVVGFDELMEALERADRKGYMPDAVKEAWEGFNWKPAQQEPVATKLESQQFHGFPVSAADFKKLKALPVGAKLYTAPQSQSSQRTVGDAESWDDRYGTGGSYGVGGCYGPAAFTDGDPNDGY